MTEAVAVNEVPYDSSMGLRLRAPSGESSSTKDGNPVTTAAATITTTTTTTTTTLAATTTATSTDVNTRDSNDYHDDDNNNNNNNAATSTATTTLARITTQVKTAATENNNSSTGITTAQILSTRVDSPLVRVSHFPHEPKSRPSILTTPEHQGFLNLAAILIIGWCIIQMHHTRKQTGKFLDFELFHVLMRDFPMMVFMWMCILAFALTTSVFLEYMFTRFESFRKPGSIQERSLIVFYVGCILSMFTIAPYFAIHRDMSPLLRGALAMQICVSVMKYHSFFMTNRYMRQLQENKRRNISKRSVWSLIKDYLDFITMPTLVYEKHFPRKERIDWFYVLKESTGALICYLCLYLVLQQHLMPYLGIAEDIPFYEHVYLLGVPTLFMWIIGFYGVFHSLLNVIAELSRFQDREFYLAWWDSTSMAQFWRLWNRAVYKFMCRHIYVESMRKVPFFNKIWAAISTYVVTAVFHEYVLAVAFGFLRPYFFTMICVQIPYVYFTDKILKGTRTGNVFMWVGFVFGFPMLQLSYAYSYFHMKPIRLF